MKGVQILGHSLRQVTNNLPDALRISGALYLVQGVVAALFGGAMMSGGMGMGGGGFGVGFILVLAITLFTAMWIAVAWHRYVLLAENPKTPLPPLMTDRMTAYFLRSLVIGIVLIVVGAVLGAVIGSAAMGLMMNGGAVIGFLLMALLVQLPLVFLGFRLATTLPGAALGKEHSFMAGWNATQADWKSILQLAAIVALGLWVINMIGLFVFGGFGIAATLWQFVTGWFVMMIGLSVLTTLYGHYIEGRPLV